MKYHWIAPSGGTNTHEVGTRRPASADRTARRQFQATGQPVSRTQASDAMTTWLPRYEAKCVQSRCFECWTLRLQDILPTRHFAYNMNTSPIGHFAYWTLRLLRGQFAHSLWTQENGGGELGPHLTQTRLGWGLRPYCMPSFIVIRPTVWLQYTNVTDRTDRQWTDSIGRTVLQTVAPKN